MRAIIVAAVLLGLVPAPLAADPAVNTDRPPSPDDGPFVAVLGIAQDGGLPQAGCTKPCCARVWSDPAGRRSVSSLAIVDPATSRRWMIDATPDFREQLHRLDRICPADGTPGLDGIFLSHAHIGHYTGLMHLGREAIGARGVPVHVMPRMDEFLRSNAPWNQLVQLRNISLRPMRAGEPVRLGGGLTVTPLPVPHRDEYTETVGFRIRGPRHSVLYISDIDRWEGVGIETLIADVDAALLDGTFFSGQELPGRDLSDIPHPFIIDTMKRLADLPESIRSRVRFIHLNHTNPALVPGSEARREIERRGFGIAVEGSRFPL